MFDLFLSLILTVVIEFLILCLFKRENRIILFLYSLLINSITLPLATFTYLYLCHDLLLIEITVVVVETIFIKILLETDYKKAFLISLAINFFTSLLGVVIAL